MLCFSSVIILVLSLVLGCRCNKYVIVLDSCNYKRSAILYLVSVITCSVFVLVCKKSVIVLLNTWSNLSLQWWQRGQLSKAHIEQLAMQTPQCTLDTSSSGGREGTHDCFLMCIFNNSQFIFHSAYLTE